MPRGGFEEELSDEESGKMPFLSRHFGYSVKRRAVRRFTRTSGFPVAKPDKLLRGRFDRRESFTLRLAEALFSYC